jgi:FMN phosphatase YigB (HAD superfamily)
VTPTITTVILDLGNVVLGFDHMIACRALARLGQVTAEEAYERVFRSGIEADYDGGQLSTPQFLNMLREVLAIPAQAPTADIEAAWGDIFWENEAVTAIVPNIHAVCTLVLLSNTNDIHWRFARSRFPVFGHFDHIVLSFEVGCRKPEVAIFQEALRRAGCVPAEAVFVDDIAEYADAARKLGLHALYYRPGETDLAQELRGLGVML